MPNLARTGASDDPAPPSARAVIGVIGHVDHGKTALVGALTGIETDRLEEERRRGISIALGFAYLDGSEAEGGASIDLIDMPGHERFVRTMVAGASGIDAALLAVDAGEGVKPQTREHVDVIGLLGVERAVVAVTRVDLAPGAAAAAGSAAADLLGAHGVSVAGVVETSAVTGAGIAELRGVLAGLARVARGGEGFACLAVDRAFTVVGHGPVVTGTLRGGAVAAGDTLDLWTAAGAIPRRVRVRAIEVHGRRTPRAEPGQRVALNLRGVETADLARGMVLAAPDALAPSEWLTLALESVADAPELANGVRLRALVGTAEVDVRLRLLDRDVLQPGERAVVQLRLAEALAVAPREPLVLRLPSPARTVAGGRVLEPVTARRRRHAPAVLARLAQLRDLPVPDLLAAEVARAGAKGTTLAALQQVSGWSRARIARLLARLPVEIGRDGTVLPLGEVARRRTLAPRADPLRAARARDLADRIAAQLREAGLTPPLPRELIIDAPARHAVDRLLREGVAVRCVDPAKAKAIIFHRDAIAGAAARLMPLLLAAPQGLLVTEIGAALGISRKFTMPLLDHFDTTGVTRRLGDRRVAGPRGDAS